MGGYSALLGVYIGAPAAAAAVTGALVHGWRAAAGVALASIAFFALAPGIIPPIGVLFPIFAGAGIAALVLTPVLALRPGTHPALRAGIGAAVVAAAGAYIVLSNPGIA